MINKQLKQFILAALHEDVGNGDHTTLATIPRKATGTARLLIKEDGIISGIEEARAVYLLLDKNSRFKSLLKDGARVRKGQVAFTVTARVHTLLKAERLVLNIMQRMSGIATQTSQYAEQIKNYPCTLIDTRKTTPGMRFLEKKAVLAGGGSNHRMGLYDMILIKDNHIDFAGSITSVLEKTKKYLRKKRKKLFVTIEARSLQDVREILSAGGADRILLDNFTPAMTRRAVKLIQRRVQTESSGNITLKNIRKYAACGVDFISVGSLTHQIKSMDLSLKADLSPANRKKSVKR